MASSVAECLREILQRYVPSSGAEPKNEYIRLVLAGPPTTTLIELFTLLTQDNEPGGQSSSPIPLPVFLISQVPEQDTQGPSCICNWDYALTVRNTYPSFILLVDVLDWDERTYSMINATDTIGTPLSPVGRTVPLLEKWNTLYAHVVRIVAQETGLPYSNLQDALRECLRDLPALEPLKQQSLPWKIVEQLIRLPAAGFPVSSDEVSANCGLLSSTDGATYSHRRRILERLADFLDDSGIQGGIDELKGTATGSNLTAHLESFGEYVRREAASASAFRRVPSYYFRCPPPSPAWWQGLNVEELEQMLGEVGRAPATEHLTVNCNNSLNQPQVSGEPYLVAEAPHIEVRHPSGKFQSLKLSRRVGRRRSVILATPGTVASPWTYIESDVPAHDSAITYIVEDTEAVATATLGSVTRSV